MKGTLKTLVLSERVEKSGWFKMCQLPSIMYL